MRLNAAARRSPASNIATPNPTYSNHIQHHQLEDLILYTLSSALLLNSTSIPVYLSLHNQHLRIDTMNNGQQAGPPAQGQPAGAQPQPQPQQQQQRKIPLFKPEQMRNLPEPFTAEERTKWEQGLRSLWNLIESNGSETQQHLEAKRKLMDFSRTLAGKLQAAGKAKAQQQAQPGQSGQPGQPGKSGQPGQSGQSGVQGQQQQPQSAAAPQPTTQGQPQQNVGQGSENVGGSTSPAQQRQQPKISQKLMEHVNSFPYSLPPNLTLGTAEATKWLGESKNKYVKALMNMESLAGRISQLDAFISKRKEDGKPLSPEEEKDFKEKREAANKSHTDAKNFVESFRQQQQQFRSANAHSQAQGQAAGSSNVPRPGPNASNGGQPPARPQMNPQQVPNPTQTVNAAIEAARNQQAGGPRPMPQVQQPNSQMVQPQMPGQSAPSSTGQMPNIKQEAGLPPQINTAITQMQGNQRPMQTNSPQSAVPRSAGIPQSATSQGQQQQQIPQPLSQSDAFQSAARSYSNTATANVMGHSHPTAPRSEANVITNKMPIPKHLPERATQLPTQVQMQQARPTYTGGPSNGGSVISQPVIPKVPAYSMEGEGDHVLSKKKLDELVRQVTGGGQGLDSGEGLTPDVEESVLNVADNFVDQVLQAACRNAKERGSKTLEIRDIQLTLERGYNIRIPGYSSDEIRTVRKIQPSPAWISKMSAVQAAKVTGGKNND
ncbi:related to general RNA polymerase II transcription factor TAF12 [Rhynchosporium graminicola]|uniref:Related to general RNA polymerase II transcription factor TAF12 n=1 Tax=Rhynchosporium graminicola TaxID=2792576 RepID=A0A1E1KQ95_9HELO|nr:related to general RNA polymerase II transcription factor TAF12 [Rhynchosporium commune]